MSGGKTQEHAFERSAYYRCRLGDGELTRLMDVEFSQTEQQIWPQAAKMLKRYNPETNVSLIL